MQGFFSGEVFFGGVMAVFREDFCISPVQLN